MKMPVLLIVDDEKPTRDALRMGFQDDYEVYTAANLSQAVTLLREESPDLVLTDLRLGGESGMDVLKAAASLPQSIMMTAYGSVDAAVEAMKQGAYDFVTKPLNLDAVELVLKRALHTRNLETANQELTTRIQADSGLQKLLGRSAAMEHVFSIIRQVAPSKTTVLIEGESGTGKELVAQAIHSLSGRPENKFVAVNCAALSPQLLESELFGHEKGSFTGAGQRRIGRFEQADGGTIFLDEIGEIDAGDPGGCAHYCRHQQITEETRPGGQIPGRPLFPPQRGPHPDAPPPGPARGRAPARHRLPERIRQGEQQGIQTPFPGRP